MLTAASSTAGWSACTRITWCGACSSIQMFVEVSLNASRSYWTALYAFERDKELLELMFC